MSPVETEEKTKNCAYCNKLLKKIKRYYRDGKYYCNKVCWRAVKEKAKGAK